MSGKDLVNIPLLFASAVILVVAYILLGMGPVDSFVSWKLAPVLLVIAYTIIIPLSVLLKKTK